MSSIDTVTVDAGDAQGRSGRVRRWLLPRPLPVPINPALVKEREEHARDVQNRIADKVTAFSGSMTFVYIHILWFGLWIGLGVERYPFGLLTMIVSLEAIFLSTFVMISQNRADGKRQVIADHQWKTVQLEDRQNQELLSLSKQILALTKEVRSYADTVQREDEQNQELIKLSKQMLAMAEEGSSSGSSDAAGSTSTTPADGAAPGR